MCTDGEHLAHNNELAACASNCSNRRLILFSSRLAMTQLTFHTRSAFVARQRQGSRDPESPSSVSALEGNAQARMARVRRNSHTGRGRHASDQPEQRDIRPRDALPDPYATTSPPSSAPAPAPPPSQMTQVLPYTPYPAVNTVIYRGMHPPPQLVTSNWTLAHNNFPDNRSPEGHTSPENSTAAFSVYDSSSFTSDRNRTLSPLEYTPAHSVASFDRSQSQDGISAFLSSRTRTRSDSGSTNFLDRNLHHGVLISLVF